MDDDELVKTNIVKIQPEPLYGTENVPASLMTFSWDDMGIGGFNALCTVREPTLGNPEALYTALLRYPEIQRAVLEWMRYISDGMRYAPTDSRPYTQLPLSEQRRFLAMYYDAGNGNWKEAIELLALSWDRYRRGAQNGTPSHSKEGTTYLVRLFAVLN